MRRRIRTFTRSERPLLLATGLVTLVALAVFVIAAALGDQRRVTVVTVSPAGGESVPSSLRSISLTFSAAVDRTAIESGLRLQPSVPGVTRWRGRTLEYVFDRALESRNYLFTLPAGSVGANGEEFESGFSLAFTVRAPSVVFVRNDGGEQALMVADEAGATSELVRGERIRDYAISPDGGFIAVVVASKDQARLAIIDTVNGGVRDVTLPAGTELDGLAWQGDSQALLAARRDPLPNGALSVPRTWLLRVSGEFVAPIDPEGSPNQAAAWSPDAQSIAYIAPATAEVIVRNLSTQETRALGAPRGGAPAWSPDSRLVAFESAPESIVSGSVPPQPVRVVALDGSVDRFTGIQGEIRSAPRFLDGETLMMLLRGVGPGVRGTQLVFEDAADGTPLRTVQLTAGSDRVLSWDLDPAGTAVVYSVQAGNVFTVLRLNLESGRRDVLGFTGERPRWLP